MTPISTVTGPVDSSRLGFTLMHEHIVVSSWAMRQSYPGWFDREIVVKQAVEGLKAARACGVQTIVDVTTSNLGRDIYILREVSEKSEVQIIASTGLFYTEEPWMNRWEADRLVEWLLHDVEQGIQGADAKAGIIKCGTDKLGLTPLNRKLLQASPSPPTPT
jgi:phosphotriesterase-related protein